VIFLHGVFDDFGGEDAAGADDNQDKEEMEGAFLHVSMGDEVFE
jgi:hypothetical protein